MWSRILFGWMLLVSATAVAQVKIGPPSGNLKSSAVLELSNDVSAPPSTWKSFLAPPVDFSHNTFSASSVWGISGQPVEGAIVFNTTDVYNKGFAGKGLYCWLRNQWVPFQVTVPDKIRLSLVASAAAYDAAAINNWVSITAGEYNNLLVNVTGAARYATPEIYMNTNSAGGWSADYTIGGSENVAKVPASSYIIAWSVRTGSGNSSSLNSRLKISVSKNSGYTDYAAPLPATITLPANTRVYFVLKMPSVTSPPAPAYTAVYNASTYFLGNNSNAGAGPEYYVFGNNPDPSVAFSSDSYSQVISTPTRQW